MCKQVGHIERSWNLVQLEAVFTEQTLYPGLLDGKVLDISSASPLADATQTIARIISQTVRNRGETHQKHPHYLVRNHSKHFQEPSSISSELWKESFEAL